MDSVFFIKYRAKPFAKDTHKLNNTKAQHTDKSARQLGQTDQTYRQTIDRPVTTNYRQMAQGEVENPNLGSLLA